MPCSASSPRRDITLDVMRVVAILLVVWQHASEFYYIIPPMDVVRGTATEQVAWIDSLGRAGVAMFVIISGWLLLPVTSSTGAFLRKRLIRVVLPFACWCLGYAVYFVLHYGETWAQCAEHILCIPVNFGVEVGHLWFVYMLVGLYLLAPVISPWLQRCTKRELQGYLAVWTLTLFIPLLHEVRPQLWGEAVWNWTPMFYYFTGFAGFFVLGYYLRRFGVPRVWVGAAMLIVGYLSTVMLFLPRIAWAKDVPELEVPWNLCGIGAALMATGLVVLIHAVRWPQCRLVNSVAVMSYAIYLGHIMVLNAVYSLVDPHIASLWVKIPVIAVVTLVATYLIVRLLACLPKSHWWLGT